MKALVLPSTYEEIRTVLEESGTSYAAKLMEFVRPVEESEKELAQMTAQLRGGSGRTVFLHGAPGTGKSTFIESLTWRSHVGVSNLKQIDCSVLPQNSLMQSVLMALQDLAVEARPAGQVTAVVLNYLEDLEGQPEPEVRAFFRALNGILRNNGFFVIWPVTDLSDAEKMLDYASAVSGTVYFPGKEIVEFRGPPLEYFPAIAKSTIAVLNDGQTLEEFGLTEAELDKIAADLARAPNATLRGYLDKIVEQWRTRSGYLESLRERIPKPTEVWAIFSYPDAESVVGQFSRRSERLEEVWTAFHSKLWEYVPNSQRAADWTPKRLQLAIAGAIRTRIMYLPANAIVSAFAAYEGDRARKIGIANQVPDRWLKQSSAQEHLKSSPLFRLLTGQSSPPGKRKSGPAARAAEIAEPAFNSLASEASGTGFDRHINRALARALSDSLPSGYVVSSEQAHPWIPNIVPDVRVDVPDNRHICIELSYTASRAPSVVADYVLKKLDRYMKQIEFFVSSAR